MRFLDESVTEVDGCVHGGRSPSVTHVPEAPHPSMGTSSISRDCSNATAEPSAMRDSTKGLPYKFLANRGIATLICYDRLCASKESRTPP